MTLTITQAKNAARALATGLAADGIHLSHARALELVAQQLGYPDWNTAHATLVASPANLGYPVPVLRVQDAEIAREFYTGYLGFTVEWLHRFDETMPAYLRIRRDTTILDISEHQGDGTPGSVIWIPVRDLSALHRELKSHQTHRQRPGIDRKAPGGPTMEIIDPSGNTLRFCQPAE